MLVLFDSVINKYQITEIKECKNENIDLQNQIKQLQEQLAKKDCELKELTAQNDKLLIKNDTLQSKIQLQSLDIKFVPLDKPYNHQYFQNFYDEKRITNEINQFVSILHTLPINNAGTFEKKLEQIKTKIDHNQDVHSSITANYIRPGFLANISYFDFNTYFYKTTLNNVILSKYTHLPFIIQVDTNLTQKLLEITYTILYRSNKSL